MGKRPRIVPVTEIGGWQLLRRLVGTRFQAAWWLTPAPEPLGQLRWHRPSRTTVAKGAEEVLSGGVRPRELTQERKGETEGAQA